ncbi:uncharacterized protein M421DRAFT_388524 [Didymella exigua CBS 183.55]|uniref:Uncharacterized protein n=1 Tax=Didymella exigua CBS 183.55 TaxID=1150837 RepID=A0A6A5S0C2_9PLEO|nr:uncharacterized protein M421DRAFT_388524 [Didymella exigua CBS 183.55]KAF1934121.1 hypothetical protein M421DRAFT_388524 [Didymella exigua CBS 183.55]
MPGQKLGVLELWAQHVVRIEYEDASRGVCDEYDAELTLATEGVVGSVGAYFPVNDVRTVVTKGRKLEGTAVDCIDLLKLEAKLPDLRLPKGMLMLANGNWDTNAWDKFEVLEETVNWLHGGTDSNEADAIAEVPDETGAVNSSWIDELLETDEREFENRLVKALDDTPVAGSKD